MKFKILFVILFAALLSCSKDGNDCTTQNACETDNPLEVDWIKEIKNSMQNCVCEISIIQGTYQEQTVFFVALTDPLCDGIDIPTLYNCEGVAVKTFTMDDYLEFYSDVTRDKVLYRCKTE